MDKQALLRFALVLMCCYVNRVSPSCFESSINAEGFIGENISISCNIFCYNIVWEHVRAGRHRYIGSRCDSKSCLGHVGYVHTLHIFNLSFSDTGQYRCYCYYSSSRYYNSGWDLVTCYNMGIFCRAKLTLNGKQSIFNNRIPPSPLENVIEANKNDEITVECHGGAELVTNCSRHRGNTHPTNLHQIIANYSCHISCILIKDETTAPNSCIVDIFLQVHPWRISSHTSTVSVSYTDTATTSFHNSRPTCTSFSALGPLISVIVLLLMITLALCLYIVLARFHNRSECNEGLNIVNLSPGAGSSANATVGRNDGKRVKYCSTSMELETSITSDGYSEVTRINKKRLTGKQTSDENGSLTTNHFYFDVKAGSVNDNSMVKAKNRRIAGKNDSTETGRSITNDFYSDVEIVPQNDQKWFFGDPQTSNSYDRVSNFQKEDHVTYKRDACCTEEGVNDYEVFNIDDYADNNNNRLYVSLNKTKK